MNKNDRKHFILVAALALAVMLFCVCLSGCKDKSDLADESEGPEYIIPMSVNATENLFSLRFVIRDCTANKVVMNVYDNNKKVGTVERDISVTKLQGTNLTLELTDLKNKLSGNLKAEVTIYGKANADNKLDENELDRAVIQLKDYVVQLSPDTINCVVEAMNLEEKARLVTGYNIQEEHDSSVSGAVGATASFEKYGIPSIVMANGTSGILMNEKSTAYPSAAVLASTWNTSLVEKVGASVGRDAKHFNIDIVLAPGMNIQRDILNGNNYEYYSEDPLMTGLMGSAYTAGIQSEKVGASLKHFAANNQETAKNTVSSNVSERALREIYLTGFEMAIKNSNPYTVMSSYNKVNGTYSAVNRELLTGILRSEWGFRGFVMSEWAAAGDKTEMIQAQNDLSMPGADSDVGVIANAVNSGVLSESELDKCCANILRIVTKSNTFKQRNGGDLDTNGGAEIAREAAGEGMVLLKNDNGALPVQDKKVAVFGNAQIYTRISGYGDGGVNALYEVSFLQGLENAGFMPDVELKSLYTQCKDDPQGADQDENPAVDTKELSLSTQQVARAALEDDFAVICISRQTREGKDHRSGKGDFLLNDREALLISRVSEAFHKAGKKVTVLINSGNPIEVDSWQDEVDAILYTGLAGMDTGNIAADIISGKINPSGKLTVSFPISYSDTPSYGNFPGNSDGVDYREDIYVGYRYYETFGVKTAYPFGHGLSYTTFEYSDVNASSNLYTDSLSVTVNVKNTGNTAGKETVQLYVRKPSSDELEQPATVLASFAKTNLLKPGESQTVTLTINQYSMRSYSEATAEWYVDAGAYTAYVAPSVKDTGKQDLRFQFNVENHISLQNVVNRCAAPESLRTYTQAGENSFNQDGRQRTNLSENAGVTADSYEAAFYPQYAVDGDLLSRWSANKASKESTHWLNVDLGGVYRLKEILIDWETISMPYTVAIRKSEIEEWNELQRVEAEFQLNTRIELDNEARYVRIRIDKGSPCSIYELEIYTE